MSWAELINHLLREFGKWQPEKPKRVKKSTLGGAIDVYLKYSETLNTYKSYKVKARSLKYFLNHFPENKLLSDVMVKDITDYLQARQRRSSVYQARIDYINIKAMFYYFVKQGLISANPAALVSIPKIPTKQPLYLSKDEYQILLKKSTYPLNEVIIFAVATGMRLGEILSVRADDLNRDEMSITVGRHKRTKSNKTRVIPLRGDVYKMVKHKTGVLFPYKETHISHLFKIIVRNSGVNPNLHFHSLRHTFASWLIQAGISIYVVSKLLGHSDVSVTSVYSHLELSDLRCGVEKIKGG